MKVRFYATLRRIVGAKTVTFSIPEDVTVRQLVAEIVRQYPGLRAALLDESGELHSYVHVFVNGRDAPYCEDGLETVLTANDTIDIFPPVAGG
ncbi:MAG: MoaD/ThiS family protein [Ardenticatenaceae bacterium]|nr:MoaD/ThiS family protein [Ardenticatenaceae bacterium]